MALRFDTGPAAWSEKTSPTPGRKIFVLVETGPDGFARFTSASSKRPGSGDWLEVKAAYATADNKVSAEVPFDRFYMEEKIAPKAEQVYREHSAARGERNAYANVRILKGVGVIEQVFVGDQPIAEAAR